MEELRYVVLHHTGIPEPHYDLMLESSPGSPLATFRFPVWPLKKPAVIHPLGDHRRDYLEYEGPVSGDRGEVRRVAAGTYRTADRTDDYWEVILDESVTLTIYRPPPGGDRWYAEPKF
jgi:hypothetical protein